MVAGDVGQRQLLARLDRFRLAINEQFDAGRSSVPECRSLALRRACAGVQLLCHLQQDLLMPVLAPAPGEFDALHDLKTLSALSARTSDVDRQRAVAALLEGLVQLQFAQIAQAVAAADLAPAHWAELDRAASSLLAAWPERAGQRQAFNRSAATPT